MRTVSPQASRLVSPTDARSRSTSAVVLELHEVELDVLAGGEVAPAPRVGLGEVAEHLELVGLDLAVGDLHPHHLVVAALALAVDALVQAEHAEDVVVDLAGDERGERRPRSLTQLLLDLGVEGLGAELAHVDRHSRGITRVFPLKYQRRGREYIRSDLWTLERPLPLALVPSWRKGPVLTPQADDFPRWYQDVLQQGASWPRTGRSGAPW